MTQLLTSPRRLPLGWIQLAHVLSGASARRRPQFALTQPVVFRSECFAEDLDDAQHMKHSDRPAKRR